MWILVPFLVPFFRPWESDPCSFYRDGRKMEMYFRQQEIAAISRRHASFLRAAPRARECSNKTHFPSLNFRQTGSETWKWAGHLFNIWSHQPPIVRKVKICRNYVWLERAGGAATHFKLQHLDAKGTMNSNECKFANFLGVWQSFYLLFTNKTWLKTRREINHLFRRGQYIYIVTFQMYIHVVTNCG